MGLVLVLHSLAESSPNSLAPCGCSTRLLPEVGLPRSTQKSYAHPADPFSWIRMVERATLIWRPLTINRGATMLQSGICPVVRRR